MTGSTYSYSKLDSFEQCPKKYQFRYIELIKSDREGVEAFMGKRVHETLERLYKNLKLTKLESLADLLAFYESAWDKNWSDSVQVVRAKQGITPDHYREIGRRCITNYYQARHPFNDSVTLGLEEKLTIQIERKDRIYRLIGYIDRLAWNPGPTPPRTFDNPNPKPEGGWYEIHDYKTGNSLPTQADVDQDQQLALYQIGIKQRWPDAKEIKLIWHYLAFGKTLVSTRTLGQLDELQNQTITEIERIEAAQEFPTHKSALCDWCDYKPICPEWKHPVQMEALPVNDYLKNPGVQLVKAYAELEAKKSALKEEIKAIDQEQSLIASAAGQMADAQGFQVIDGPDYQLRVETKEELKAPKKATSPFEWEMLRKALQRTGRLVEVSTVNDKMLQRALRVNGWPMEFKQEIEKYLRRVRERAISLVKKKHD